jgi:two-component system sensor histidine kinase KdpD
MATATGTSSEEAGPTAARARPARAWTVSGWPFRRRRREAGVPVPFQADLFLRPRPQSPWTSYVVALALVAAALLVSELWARLIGQRNLALPFIMALMLAGGWFGVRPGLVAAVAAFATYNFLLVSPHLTITFHPSALMPFTTFLSAALLAGVMAGRLSDRARAADERAYRLTTLLFASRELSAASDVAEVGAKLVEHLRRGGAEAAIWLGEGPRRTLVAATLGAPGPAAEAATPEPETVVLQTARGLIGSACLWWTERPDEVSRHWVEAVLRLGAVSLDRASLATEVADAKLVAEREGLRTALLSSLSHDLRTPLATIMASASALSEHDDRFDAATRLEMVDAIQQESERLHRYLSNLLEMTRLESGALNVRLTRVDPAEAVNAALRQSQRALAGHPVIRGFEAPGVMVDVDPLLLEQALVNVIVNAAAFSPPGGSVSLLVEHLEGEAVISVIDEGPGIAPEEVGRIFDRFFRGQGDRNPKGGVGLGLSVTRGVIEALGGTVGVRSPVEGGRGACLILRLPAHPALDAHE